MLSSQDLSMAEIVVIGETSGTKLSQANTDGKV